MTDVPSSPPDSNQSTDIAVTIFGYIFEHRLFLFLLNLVVGAFLLLSLYSLPWLKSRGMNLRWFERYCRESENDSQSSWHESIRARWRRLRLPSPRKLFRGRTSTPSHSPWGQSSTVSSSSDSELGKLARTVNPAHVTPFISTQPSDSFLSRSSTEVSKRSSLTTSTTGTSRGRGRRLEPLRRSFVINNNLALPLVPTTPSDSDSMTDAESEQGYTLHVQDKESYHFPPSLSTLTHTESERLSIDLSDMRVMDSPISHTTGESSTTGDFGDQIIAPSPGRYRPPTYGTLFSQQSIITLPVYREQEDDRISVASRAPTYSSTTVSRIMSRPSHGARPPLPLPPPTIPLPAPPPSSYHYFTII
ncbi:hypothetical protein D9756_008330 [Leucocoprinus leucothites]|uniref:Uncharacterized protein n=1 Tax=Leucocoprinus leucothites TaxID=201217 RepID=A0A8H5FW56_9AGAR|nr:hypothetical protein D9756_008330 [Leucoagaricus leucothites]